MRSNFVPQFPSAYSPKDRFGRYAFQRISSFNRLKYQDDEKSFGKSCLHLPHLVQCWLLFRKRVRTLSQNSSTIVASKPFLSTLYVSTSSFARSMKASGSRFSIKLNSQHRTISMTSLAWAAEGGNWYIPCVGGNIRFCGLGKLWSCIADVDCWLPFLASIVRVAYCTAVACIVDADCILISLLADSAGEIPQATWRFSYNSCSCSNRGKMD